MRVYEFIRLLFIYFLVNLNFDLEKISRFALNSSESVICISIDGVSMMIDLHRTASFDILLLLLFPPSRGDMSSLHELVP